MRSTSPTDPSAGAARRGGGVSRAVLAGIALVGLGCTGGQAPAAPGRDHQLDDGIAAVRRRDTTHGLALLAAVAVRGRGRQPAEAALAIAGIFQAGDGVPRDPAIAADWLALAGASGSPHAMFLLANAYHAGAGVPRDDSRAVALYRRAGELDDAAALQALSLAYTTGDLGLPVDDELARQLAAEAEHALGHVAATGP